ncbi:MAG: hypothetical protein JSS69_17245 [Acidobacteria bacterium]|nr:hypothetical protein [Acidobacteriota bacterium]MBS1867663.1 hypothetical protein [Acidobacteriota bacterium]
MQEQTNTVNAGGFSGKAKTGRVIFWLGTLVFAVESWLLIGQVAEFWRATGAESLGWMAAVGMAAQRALALLVWNQGLLLAAAAKVLVLCCPLLVIAVGFGMMRKANYMETSETAGQSATVKEERR